MHCLQFDIPDKELMEPSNIFQIRTGYVLSTKFELMGISVMLLCISIRFHKMSLHHKAMMVSNFNQNNPESVEAFESYFKFEKQKNSVKHLPKALLVASIMLERDMKAITKDWITNLEDLLTSCGYTGLLSLCKKDEFEYYFFQNSEKSTPTCLNAVDILTNKEPQKSIDEAIWLLPENLYHEDLFKAGCIKNIDTIRGEENYLIEFLKIPDLNLLTIIELKMLKEQLKEKINDFQKEAEVWASKCYKEKNGANYFKEKVFPMIATVQAAFDENPILNQWSNDNINKPVTTVYIGEVTPETIWRFHKMHTTINDETLQEMQAAYALEDNYMIPVMVFAYNTNSLKLQTEAIIDIENRAAIFGVKKNIRID